MKSSENFLNGSFGSTSRTPGCGGRLRILGCLFLLAAFLGGCASGPSARIKQNPEAFAAFPEDVQENVRAGEIELGYTEEMVEMALGKPNRVTTRERAEGTERVWIYTRTRSSLGLSVGTGFATGSRGSATGVGAGVGTRSGGAEETMRVVFSGGRVAAIERVD